jgi:predicted permease
VVVNIDPVLAGYKPARIQSLYRRLHDSLAAMPGVASVTFSLYSPLNGDEMWDGIFVQGRPAPAQADDNAASIDRVSTQYFETIGNPIVRGRPISDQDTENSRHVAVVNEAFARKFFKNEDAIGKHFGRGEIQTSGEYEVIGIAKDAHYFAWNLTKPVAAAAFLPEIQSTAFVSPATNLFEVRSHFLTDTIIRMRAGTKLTEQQVRRALSETDPNLPLVSMHRLAEQVAGNFNQQRLIARLTSLFGILALVLASVGLYGVTAYGVGSRTNEIGLRMALGADRGNVLALILRGALALTAVGLLLGIPLSLASSRLLGTQLYGINRYDPAILGAAILVLSSAALAAALIPALRASSISPLQALRAE